MRFDILTLFTDTFSGYLSQSLLNRAREREIIQIHVHDMRQWTTEKHHKIDDKPYGGGPGMVLMVEPVVKCVRAVQAMATDRGNLIMLTPAGRQLNQPLVELLACHRRSILLCGRYEGFDQRVADILQPQEISIGDYVLGGGEVAAMVLIDAMVRLVPGVLGDEQSGWDDSFSRGNRWLEYPQYTRPQEFEGHRVPEVLLSGNHQEIERWRRAKSLENTRQRRSDLIDQQTTMDDDIS